MQLNGIGVEHNASMHQVTKCSHDHTTSHKEGASAAAQGAGREMQILQMPMQQEGQLSLTSWLEKTLAGGKRALQGIWGTNESGVPGDTGDKAGNTQVMPPAADNRVEADVSGADHRQQEFTQGLHTPQVAAAGTAVTDPGTIQNTAYYSAVEDIGRKQETLWEKVKVKFKNIAGQLAGNLPNKLFHFQTKNSFQTRQEPPREELRKQNKIRKDKVELNCAQVEESYLLDSYDRKGAYSKLSAGK